MVEPSTELDPYNLALSDLSAAERRAWGERVARALTNGFGPLTSITFEVHAGAAYRRAIEPAIAARGGSIAAPLEGVPLGSQLAWYRDPTAARARATTNRREASTAGEFRAAVQALDRKPRRIAARDWPDGLTDLAKPGLYSWWVDADGAADLSAGLGQLVRAARIYAGQTGATRWPSGTTGKATLTSRIGGNHLGGRIRGSTFRLTLAARLGQPLALVRAAPRRLDAASELRLGGWMREHLALAVYPVADRDPLADLERRVLRELDPPLNLERMPPTPLRIELTRLRASLAADPPAADPLT